MGAFFWFSIGRITMLARSIATFSPRFVLPLAPRARFASSTDAIEIPIDNPYKFHKCEGPGDVVKTSSEEMINAFKTMYTVRRMEQGADKMYKARKIQGFLHLYNGQEAIVTGIEAALTKKDSIITAYRDHGFAYTRGCEIKEIYAELMGKVTGCSKGNGGSMHMYKGDANFYGGNGIVGAQTPVGAGIAFTHKYKKTDNVCVSLYGDGSANQGQLFEAYNMASLWKLPVIYVCENNKYGMGTSVNRAAANHEFYTRGDFVPGIRVDGMDFLAVKNAAAYAKEYAVEKGPIVLEMVTYRYVGHSMSDPGTTYRTREEVDEQRKLRDPIEKLKNQILTSKICTDVELKGKEKEIRKEIDEAAKQAEEDPYPDLEQTFQNIYWNETISVRGVERVNSFFP